MKDKSMKGLRVKREIGGKIWNRRNCQKTKKKRDKRKRVILNAKGQSSKNRKENKRIKAK